MKSNNLPQPDTNSQYSILILQKEKMNIFTLFLLFLVILPALSNIAGKRNNVSDTSTELFPTSPKSLDDSDIDFDKLDSKLKEINSKPKLKLKKFIKSSKKAEELKPTDSKVINFDDGECKGNNFLMFSE